ncbi:MAG TPA: hypothetical protein VF629_16835 [Hymenobacter sp.]|jgi:hypothetical protein|uniref:hypothetical protein n=1 Tax=Hymenobacter sp. TaxID=1898978 RepID=UPI002EDA7D3D
MKNNKIKALALAMLFCSSLLSCQQSDIEPNNRLSVKKTQDFTIFKFKAYIGRPAQGCLSGWGVCQAHLVIFNIPVFRSTKPEDPKHFTGYVENNGEEGSNTKKLVFQFMFPEEVEMLGNADRNVEVEQALQVNSETAHAFGYESMTIQPGSYEFTPSLGENGGFKVGIVVQ